MAMVKVRTIKQVLDLGGRDNPLGSVHILYNADGVGGGFRFCYSVLYMVGGGFDFCYITLEIFNMSFFNF